jgi:SAM-dependent methyltransferase
MFRGPAEIYDRFVGRYSPRLARAMCEAADVREGQRVLDVGCGSGVLVAELAGIVGAEGVAGIDPSEPFVEASRAAHLGRASSSDRPSQSPSQTHAEAGLTAEDVGDDVADPSSRRLAAAVELRALRPTRTNGCKKTHGVTACGG